MPFATSASASFLSPDRARIEFQVEHQGARARGRNILDDLGELGPWKLVEPLRPIDGRALARRHVLRNDHDLERRIDGAPESEEQREPELALK